MRMKGGLFHRFREWMLDHAYWVTLGAVMTVIAASALYTRGLEQQATGVQAAANAPEVTETAAPQMEATLVPLATLAPLSLHSTLRLGGTTVWPVSGGVIRGFDGETPVLWEALDCVQLHAAVDLAGRDGEEVRCVMDGTISGAVRDELWGWRVAVAQTDGQQAVYAGLAACDVTAGQNVTRGQTIGTLLERIPCEAELGTHLHLELTQDGERRDPTDILPDQPKGTET